MHIIPNVELPFLSKDAVLFLSNEEGSRIDECIAQDYEYFNSMFEKWGFSLVYLPEVFARLSSEALSYCFPDIQDGDINAKAVNDRIMAMLHIEPYTGFLFHGEDGLHFYCAENGRINLGGLRVVLQTHRVREHRPALSKTEPASESPKQAFDCLSMPCATPSIEPVSLRLKRKMKGMAELFKVDAETEDDTFASMQTVPASVAEEEPDILDPKARAILDEIDGVYSLAPRPAAAAERLLSPAAQRPVQTTLHDGAAVIDISVYLCFGCRMKEVSALIQQRVKDAVQDMTGIAVSRVNIYIAGVKAREV